MAIAHEIEQVTNFEAILDKLADNMRIYDKLDPQRSEMLEKVAEIEETLADLDIEIPLVDQPSELALSALELIIAQRKLIRINSAMREVDIDGLKSLGILHGSNFYQRKVTVRSRDGEQYRVFTSRRNSYGLLEGTGRYHESKSGEISELWLDSQSGGAISFLGKMGRVYSAGPLIDRYNDYSPAFEITLR